MYSFIFNSKTGNIEHDESLNEDFITIDGQGVENQQMDNHNEIFVVPNSKNSRKSSKMNELQRGIIEVLSKWQHNSQASTCEVSDENKLFLLSFLPILNRLCDPQKYDFKIKMLQVLKNIQYPQTSNYSYPNSQSTL